MSFCPLRKIVVLSMRKYIIVR